MDRLQLNAILFLKVLANFGNEHIHAPAQEIIFLTPDIHQYLFPLQHPVDVEAEIS